MIIPSKRGKTFMKNKITVVNGFYGGAWQRVIITRREWWIFYWTSIEFEKGIS